MKDYIITFLEEDEIRSKLITMKLDCLFDVLEEHKIDVNKVLKIQLKIRRF